MLVLDHGRAPGATQLLVRALTLAVGHAADEAAFYVWHASERRREVEWALAAAGLEERQQLVWVKEHFRLLAADQEGRLGLGIELEPRYVAVGLERFVAAGRCPPGTAPRRVGGPPPAAGRPGRRRPDRGERRT